MKSEKSLAGIRRDYGCVPLNDEEVDPCPLIQFDRWFAEIILTEQYDPTAMVLSTVDEQGCPDARVVLLKGIEAGEFIFYTNYHSPKAQQMTANAAVALTFYWPSHARQVCVRGQARRTSEQQSDDYFFSRPLASQWSAVISQQSAPLSSRAELESVLNMHCAKNIPPTIRPEYWGGYAVRPEEIEFWQGRDNRLHDRILYSRHHETWRHFRIAP